MADAGFIFWGLLAILSAIPVGYVLWMWWVERGPGRDPGPGGRDPGPGGRDPGPGGRDPGPGGRDPGPGGGDPEPAEPVAPEPRRREVGS